MKPNNFSQVPYAGSTLVNIQSRKRNQVDAETLAKLWNIDHKKALKNITCTTQQGIRSFLRPSLSRSYPKTYSVMCYNRLPHSMLSYTLNYGFVSKRGNKYGRDYFTQYRWSRCHPMKLKSEAHEYMSMLFKHDGVPPNIVFNNSKDQSLDKFYSKYCEADCHIVNTNPYYPWMMAAEGCIKHLNQGSSRKMLKS